MRFSPLIAIYIVGCASFAQDIKLERSPSRWRLGWERFDPHDRDDAQLVGLHYDMLGILEAYEPFYAGLGGYAQFAGTNRSFFAAGLTSGVLYPLGEDWRVEAGLFLGGGGVSGNERQGGLVTRPFLAIERLFTTYGLRAELAYLDLEGLDGDLTLSLGISLPSEWLEAGPSQKRARISKAAVHPRETRLSARFLALNPSSDSLNRGGADLGGDLEMLGVGVDYFLDRHWFVPLEAYGASGGDLVGLGLGLVGLGYRYPLGESRYSIEAKASLGIASGSAADTGSGLALGAGAALRAGLTESLSAELGGFLVDAPNGEFGAAGLSLGLSWTAFPIELAHAWPRSELASSGLAAEAASIDDTSIGLLNKFYSPKSSSRDSKGRPLLDTISLLGIELEKPIHGFLSATARAFVAWDGDVGGYREGLLGLRASHSTLEDPDHVFGVGFEVGSAGGGRLDVGSGLLLNLYAGYQFHFDERCFISLELGRTHSDTGTFEAESVLIGMGWNLNRALSR